MKSGKLDIKEKTIQTVLSWYRNDQIQINRRYQRKLVWSLEEKRLFINSIMEDIPIPSIIMARREYKSGEFYEVIDGLQRLEALISFLTNEFAVHDGETDAYFNLESDAWLFTEQQKKNLSQKKPVMKESVCLNFLDAVLPIVVINGADDKSIEEIFKRINSSGQRLSNQELRQSSSCNGFSEMVRKMSCVVRGDQTFSDLLNLSDMKKISVSQKGLNYGIDRESVFWRKHDIITDVNLRKSRDEELIAKFLIEFFAKIPNPTPEEVDDAYLEESDLCKELCSKIKNEPENNYYLDRFNDTYNDIQNVFNSRNTTYSEWCFKEKKSAGKNDSFRMILTVLYELYLDGYVIDDYKIFCDGIKFIGDNALGRIKEGNVKKEDWQQIKDSLRAFIKTNMQYVDNSVEESDLVKTLRIRFGESPVESQMTEYKIGISSFGGKKINHNVIKDIVKAMVAMSNTDNAQEGMVIVGVADTKDQADEWRKAYNQSYNIIGKHYIVGLEPEVKKLYGNMDFFVRMIKDRVKNEPIGEDLKNEILSKYEIVTVKDKELLIFRVKSKVFGMVDNTYNGDVYIRRGNSTEKK